jgi:hypothetical protein
LSGNENATGCGGVWFLIPISSVANRMNIFGRYFAAFSNWELLGAMEFRVDKTDTDIELEPRRTTVGIRIYLWLYVLSILVFLAVEYFAATLQFPPGQFPPGLALWLNGPTAILSGGALGIGFWGLRRDTAPRAIQIIGKTLGAFLLAILALSVIGCVQALMVLVR